MLRVISLLLLLPALFACPNQVDPIQPRDAAPNAGTQIDAGPMDAQAMDTGALDAGTEDVGPVDTGEPDAGPADTGPADTGPGDAQPVGRSFHTATLLQDGRVLIAGGVRGGPGFTTERLGSASIFDPATETFTPVADMNAARSGHTATLLSDGRVLIAGGRTAMEAIDTTEIFDPGTNQFTFTSTMARPREAHVAQLLPNGEVLLAGGQNRTEGALEFAEIYNPGSDQFRTTQTFMVRQAGLPNLLPVQGGFLIAGGHNGGSFNDAQIYDPATESFVATGDMIRGRVRGFGAALPDGRALIGGGSELNVEVDTIEIYDPVTGTFSPGGTVLNTTRILRSASVLDADTVMIAGGYQPVELYSISNGTSTLAPADATFFPRAGNSATTLNDGRILFAGGGDSDGFTIIRADLFDPTTETFLPTGDLPSN